MLALGRIQKIVAVYFIFLQKSMAISAVVDKNGLEAGLDTGNDAFVDIAVGNLLEAAFNAKAFKLVFFDCGDSALTGVDSVYQNFYTHTWGP
jgi:hypothetical protein